MSDAPSPPSAQAIIAKLDLQPHPEGGWYRETWRGPPTDGGTRGCATSILFLLEAGQRSHWHRVDASELWLHQGGGALRLLTALDGESSVVEHRIGPNIASGDTLQQVVRPGEWQSAEALDGWALVACVVTPAFEFAGFEMAPAGWAPGQIERDG